MNEYTAEEKLKQMNIGDVTDVMDIDAVSKLQLIALDQFDVGIYVADGNQDIIYRPVKPNLIADTFFFESGVYKQLLGRQAAKSALSATVCKATGIVIAVKPIMFLESILGYYIFVSNTQGHMDRKLLYSLSEGMPEAVEYLRYYDDMKPFDKPVFDTLMGIFDSFSGIEAKMQEKVRLLSDNHNLMLDLVSVIVGFHHDMMPVIAKNLMNFYHVDNVSMALRSASKGSIYFAQSFNDKKLIFSEGELINLYEHSGFYKNNAQVYLKEHMNKYAEYLAVYNFVTDGQIVGYMCLANEKEPLNLGYQAEATFQNLMMAISDIYASKVNSYKYSRVSDMFFGVLDKLDIAVRVTDTETNELLYSNKKYLEEEAEADVLYGGGSGENLPFLPEKNGEYYNPSLNKWYFSNSMPVTWIDGHNAIIEFRIDITENKAQEETIQTLVWKNKLTNLPNRAKLSKDLTETLRNSQNSGYILLMNLDLFGHINDSYGYEFGDKLIQEVVRFLLEFEKDLKIYHLTGAEFVLICDKTNLIMEVVQRIEDRFREPWIVETVEQYCTSSIGIASYPRDGRYPEQLIKNASLALKMAKQGGRNRVYYFDSFEDDKFARSLQLEYYLRYAVMKHMEYFKVYYQPIVSAYTGEIVSMEALVRWFDPEIGFVSPGEFIELAESLGLIDKIDNFVLDRACRFTKKIHDMGFSSMRFNVNLSARQLFEDNVVDAIEKTIAATGVDFNCINLEVTETVAISDLGKATERLNQLRNMGISIALDDFGVGYSSLNSLKNLPISTVKIDKDFITDMHKTQYNYTFIKTIIELAHSADLKVCCEGVEKENELYELRKMGCDMMQGFFFSKPVPEEELLKLLTGEN